MQIEELLKRLKSKPWYRDNIVEVKEIPPRGAAFKGSNFEFSPPLRDWLKSKGIGKLYSHQVQALNYIFEGKNVIITTPTASGKTLCFLLPILDSIYKEPKGRALLIYPLKALTNDQYKLLREIKQMEFKADIYDGDTPSSKRAYIRERANIILTNPYELHQVLPYHFKWASFFRNLKFIVVDEAHRYRGVFGSNVANLFRRLRRVLNFYKAKPIYILSSASIGNPIELAQGLVGEEFHVIGEDGSPQDKKVILLWNSKGSPNSYLVQAKEIFLELLNAGFKTLCFLRSRKNVELIRSWLKDRQDIASYRAGYLPGHRRQIESDLRGGKLKGVLSTNALELGIDIGELDACIIVGFPGSISSFWQQAGRVGRKKDCLIIYIALEDALEQYLLRHPEVLLDPEFERANIGVDNPYILTRHAICASSELPIKVGEYPDSILRKLEAERMIAFTSQGYVYTGGGRPQGVISLENISDEVVKLMCNGELLETMDYERALKEVYPGAVYLSQGKTYLVRELNLEEKIAELEEKDLDYFTEAVKIEEVEIEQTYKTSKGKGLNFHLGRCRIRERILGYKIRKFDQAIGFKELQLPEIKFNSHAIWFEVSKEIVDEVRRSGFDFDGSLHALEHLFIGLAPLLASCDRNDLGGRAYPLYPQLGVPLVFIFEAYPGGVGIVETIFERMGELLKISLEHLERCRCEGGCPSCVLSPKCGNNNMPMDKLGAKILLSLAL